MSDSSPRAGGRALVWIVEDSPLEATLAARVLMPEFEVVIFAESASVIEALSTTTSMPDVILTDWVLPGIDGLELCRLIRQTYPLVANAVVHGEKTKPVDVTATEDGGDSLLVVHNEGRPVPETMRATLFDPFRRAIRTGSGLGLGLYITRELAKAHGGDVTYTSSAEEGTTFTVRLPCSVAAAAGSAPRVLA